MMKLPKFTDPAPSAEKLRVEQQRLHDQADKMLQMTGLAKILQQYGQLAPIGGSYAYGLMVYPDLDISIICDTITTDQFANLALDIIRQPFVRKVSTVNNVDYVSLRKGHPKGYWIGIEIPFEQDVWGIDCWIQTKAWAADTTDHYAARMLNITDAQRDAILQIKYQLILRGCYGDNIVSVDVYDAVLDQGITTVDAFLAVHQK